MQLDLSAFESVRQFSTQIKTEYPHFHCIIHNAGISTKQPQIVGGSSMTDLMFATNHLGPFLLTELLVENIRANHSRIAVVSSSLHVRGRIDFETLGQCGVAKTAKLGYMNSKLANFYMARELYQRGFDVHVICPGLCNSELFRDYNPRWYHYVLFAPIVLFFLRSCEQVFVLLVQKKKNAINFNILFTGSTKYYLWSDGQH